MKSNIKDGKVSFVEFIGVLVTQLVAVCLFNFFKHSDFMNFINAVIPILVYIGLGSILYYFFNGKSLGKISIEKAFIIHFIILIGSILTITLLVGVDVF